MGQTIKNLIVLAAVVGGAYYLWNWQFGSAGGGDVKSYAEKSCSDAIRSQHGASAVRVNSVQENANGFVVRASMTLERGDVARVTCLTNSHGSVEDIMAYER